MEPTVSESLIEDLATRIGLEIVDRAHLPAQRPKYKAVPPDLDAAVRNFLTARYKKGLYSHQSAALHAALKGADVCLSTSTASGKSLVFMAYAAHLIQRTRSCRVLALYPARALIQDQIEKWEEILSPLGIGFGYIPVERRAGILETCEVVLMTPDVAHAWLMSHLREREVRNFLSRMGLLVLDEAHVYEGVFGTNMAYFLRRLQVAAARHQIICSTATLGEPADFILQLTGRESRSFGPEADGSEIPSKTVLLTRDVSGSSFESIVNLLVELARIQTGRFLAFADSRRMVEQVVAAVHRSKGPEDDDDEIADEDDPSSAMQQRTERDGGLGDQRVLPYRAGYETEDRKEIQKALGEGRLVGVVSTSAMELGIDIGEIDLIVLLNVPPSVKAFWQRAGRGGRRRPGVCLVLDIRGTLAELPEPLASYSNRALEPSWLYLQNRYIQYTNALCAALEISEMGGPDHRDLTPFRSLPPSFQSFLENELNPTEIVPADLYPLKQRAQAGPHREFPIRSGIEQDFQVKDPHSRPLGTLTLSQVLREGYPGAIYHYMALPYRVYRFQYRTGEIFVRRERRWTTRPLAQAMVFPRFQGGTLTLFQSERGFLAEAEMQVSERVLGFTEQRGSVKSEHRYGPTSPYYQRELNRFFETTGVCWYFGDRSVTSEPVASRILEAFALDFGIQERDLGVGIFHSKHSPLGPATCQGVCVFDATHGSLRLTQRIAEHFSRVLEVALGIATSQGDSGGRAGLETLAEMASHLKPQRAHPTAPVQVTTAEDWVTVVAPGEDAVYAAPEGMREVQVVAYRYTPQGLMYELAHPDGVTKWLVPRNAIQPIHGHTKLLRTNLVTGESHPES